MTAPLVQVVQGTDWAGVTAAVAGGLVGLVGVGATVWSTRRAISADEVRLSREDRRRVYARFHSCMDAMALTLVGLIRAKESDLPVEEASRRLAGMYDARSALLQVHGEVMLLAPADIADIATELVDFYKKYIGLVLESDHPQDARPRTAEGKQSELLLRMRSDLGTSPALTSPRDQYSRPKAEAEAPATSTPEEAT